jgi:repressor of nif and glnA expression
MDVDELILDCIDEKFMTVTQITEELTNQGFEVNRNTVQVHIKKLSKYGDIFSIFAEGGRRGVVPLRFKKVQDF